MSAELSQKPVLLILYASQTGNAQDVAELIGREAQRRHYVVRVVPADAYLPCVSALPSEPALLFVASTTGQGEAPDNVRQLWRFLLRKSLPPDSLTGVRAAVFGLGDSGYPQFNVTAKKLFRRLEALGARMLLPLGLGDDQQRGGYESALDPWLDALWPALRAHCPLPPGLEEPAPGGAPSQLECRYRVTWLSAEEAVAAAAAADAAAAAAREGGSSPSTLAHWDAVAAAAQFDVVEAAASGLHSPPSITQQQQQQQQQGPSSSCSSGANPATEPSFQPNRASSSSGSSSRYGPGHPYWARLASNRRITAPTHFQDVRQVDFDLGASGLAFQPGDVLAVVPQQSQAAVDALLQRCGWDPQAWVRIQPAALATEQRGAAKGSAGRAGVAGGCCATVRVGALVAGAVDISGASPRRFFFQVLHQFAGCEAEAERLAFFSSAAGRDELYEYNRREGRTVLEVLSDFKRVQLPLEWLLQAAPRLRPRYFTIASSLKAHPSTAQLAVAVVSWVTPLKRRRRGVCSSWLAGLDPSQGEVRVPVWVERGALRLPPGPEVPLIMVGPGTGVAPFRAFLQHRAAMAESGESPSPAPCMLVFGCRNEAGDFYFRTEWEAQQAAGILAPPPAGLLTAFSRDTPSKVYVQQRIREAGAQVWHMMQQGAWIYVAGSADKMPGQVAAAFEEVVAQQGGMSHAEAAALLRRMQLSGRYQVEAWR